MLLHSFLHSTSCFCYLVSKSCLTLVTSCIIAGQAPLSLGFPRQEYWSGLPFPSLTHSLNSVHFIHSVVSKSLWPHGLQHTRLPRPSPTPRAYSNSCPLSRWCHPTISSSVVPFSSCLQSFPALGLFQGVSSSHQVVKVLEFQLQYQSFQWIFRTDFL